MDAFIYDHVRSPRGKGKRDGALHEVTAVELARQVLVALRDRSTLDTRLIEDVVLGCVMPVGEQGADIARIAALMAGYDESVPGVQINRFCSSGLEAVNMAAAKVMAGQALAAIGGGVESMSRVPMGSDGGAWAVDPAVAFPSYFVPQGISADLVATLHGYSRRDLDAYAVASQQRAATAWAEGRFARSVVPIHDLLGIELLAQDETVRGSMTLESLAALKPSFADIGEKYGADGVSLLR